MALFSFDCHDTFTAVAVVAAITVINNIFASEVVFVFLFGPFDGDPLLFMEMKI